jgi:hypothetical protein
MCCLRSNGCLTVDDLGVSEEDLIVASSIGVGLHAASVILVGNGSAGAAHARGLASLEGDGVARATLALLCKNACVFRVAARGARSAETADGSVACSGVEVGTSRAVGLAVLLGSIPEIVGVVALAEGTGTNQSSGTAVRALSRANGSVLACFARIAAGG